MKRNQIIFFTLCLFSVSFFYALKGTAADKGRKFYEEAGHIVWKIKTEENIVALTFDDGPHLKYTTEILELLKKYGAKATFFIVGESAEKNPQIILQMYEEGHELANHTYTHPLKASVPQLVKEIKQTNEAIYSSTGYRPNLFRPVEGQYTDALINSVVEDVYKVVLLLFANKHDAILSKYDDPLSTFYRVKSTDSHYRICAYFYFPINNQPYLFFETKCVMIQLIAVTTIAVINCHE